MKILLKTLQATSLNAADFAPFGDVVEAGPDQVQKRINDGNSVRYHDLAVLQGAGGRISVNIFRSDYCQMPVTIKQMERHPRASQCFMPLGTQPYLVIVAPAGDFEWAGMRAFIAASDQGVNYHAGIWHHHNMSLNQKSDFLVLDYIDLDNNCDIMELPEPVQVTY